MSEPASLEWEHISAARARLVGRVRRTPVLTSASLDTLSGAHLFFKCEMFQNAGAFKARGATNAIFALEDTRARHGVVTHSSGNHAAALARAAALRGIAAHVVMPRNAARAKRAAAERYGARIQLCEPTLADRERAAEELRAATGATLVHPYDDLQVMAGQATAAVELLEEVGALDLLLCPVGGGGLLGGSAVAAHTLQPALRVFGAEPAGADDAARSLRAGHILPSEHPQTIADGLRSSLGVRPFAVIRRCVSDIVTVSDVEIIAAMRELWEILKVLAEPSAAVPYAAVRAGRVPARGARVGIILSGGNLDLERLPWQA
ncbi:MAG: pyridoxal-phosphate dependent enzyme [Gammaproteobacteria bacterium]|nr:pyridoxal-phosphate dependent enzyme [Gammaproteobacteria bacterium]